MFLSEEEQKELAEFVILDPAWLLEVMKVVYEIERHDNIQAKYIKDLKNTGFASSKLLEDCWSEFTGYVLFQQLCLMLQANCLLCRVNSVSYSKQAESDLIQCANKSSQEATAEKEMFYLVPCRLPKECKCNENATQLRLNWLIFYFDFQKFFPIQIYYHLICLILDNSQSERSRTENTYSTTCCILYNSDECHWKIELEQNVYRLKVSVL